MKDHQIFQYPNGIRIVHKQVNNTKIIHCGFIIDIGSRDEHTESQGLAHFWEHMVFKGTQKRKAYHIINRLESVGGELNAFTTKEKICFYASVLEEHFDMAVELLTDITFNSIFPEKQIEKERLVILDEMAMYLDNPEDSLQDDFDKVIFGDHSLGNNILGTEESLNSIKKPDFLSFIEGNLSNDEIIFSVVGSASHKQIFKTAERYLSQVPLIKSENKRVKPDNVKGIKITEGKKFVRSYCAIGGQGYDITNTDRIPFFMLINLLGGPALNSRLNLSLREKYGYVYSIDASFSSYTDTGIFGIFFGTEKKYLDKSIKLVMRELKLLKDKKMGTLQLHKAKQQLKGQLAMAEENNANLMIMMGRSLLDQGKIDSLDSIFNQINEVSSIKLMDISNEMFNETDLNYLIYQPL
jgi:predicted Zn-dependent peptidase